MFCRNCGTNLPDGAAFCANCGNAVAEVARSAASTAVADLSRPHTPPVSLVAVPGEEDKLFAMTKAELGRDYRIERELGRGGMAVVYRGIEVALDRPVAIKVVPPDSANVGQAAERFRREAKLAASLDHPNIIPVYRVGQAGPLHFMAMKFVEGRAVDAIIEQQGALPLAVCVAILRAAAAGLAFAHERKIVHRDIKPANILIDRDGRVMVSDFGIARALEEVSMTASGMMIGTPYYMSPEQCGGQKVSPQSDQYSLGIMGFQMLTGEVPFLADSMVGVIQHHYMTPVPDILTVRPEVPKELLDVVYCALNKDPNDRFATSKDMVVALDNVPVNATDRDEADRILRELSAGLAIPKIRTGTLPPLALTISGPGPKVQPRPSTQPRLRAQSGGTLRGPARRRKKKKNMVVLAAALLMLLGAGSGGGYLLYSQSLEDERTQRIAERTRADSLARMERLSKGSRVIMGLPDGVGMTLNSRVYFNGDTFTAEPSTYSGSASHPNFEPIAGLPVAVVAGRFDTLFLSMRAAVVAQAGTVQLPTRPAPQTRVVLDTGRVRFIVLPTQSEIVVDGQKIGNGRFLERFLTVGTHRVRYSAPNCDPEEVEFMVVKGESVKLLPPVNLTCR